MRVILMLLVVLVLIGGVAEVLLGVGNSLVVLLRPLTLENNSLISLHIPRILALRERLIPNHLTTHHR